MCRSIVLFVFVSFLNIFAVCLDYGKLGGVGWGRGGLGGAHDVVCAVDIDHSPTVPVACPSCGRTKSDV